MQTKNILLVILLALGITSCRAQQLVQKTSDAILLQKNKDRFVNKPLKSVVQEIKPPIKAVTGNAEFIKGMPQTIRFHFTSEKEYYERKKNGENPTRILLRLVSVSDKKYPKIDLDSVWTDEQTKIYGDLMVLDLSVIGEK